MTDNRMAIPNPEYLLVEEIVRRAYTALEIASSYAQEGQLEDADSFLVMYNAFAGTLLCWRRGENPMHEALVRSLTTMGDLREFDKYKVDVFGGVGGLKDLFYNRVKAEDSTNLPSVKKEYPPNGGGYLYR